MVLYVTYLCVFHAVCMSLCKPSCTFYHQVPREHWTAPSLRLAEHLRVEIKRALFARRFAAGSFRGWLVAWLAGGMD